MIDGKKVPSRTVTPPSTDKVVPGGKTAHDSTSGGKTASVLEHVKDLEQQVEALKEADRRSKADYQNLLRRTQDERSKLVKLATQELASDLLQPLDHLSMAAEQLNDVGLTMVIKQFWVTLNAHGLTEIEVQGQPFDPLTMEAVERHGDDSTVTKVVTRGYRLNGEVIRHAKVIVGQSTPTT